MLHVRITGLKQGNKLKMSSRKVVRNREYFQPRQESICSFHQSFWSTSHCCQQHLMCTIIRRRLADSIPTSHRCQDGLQFILKYIMLPRVKMNQLILIITYKLCMNFMVNSNVYFSGWY